VSMSSKSGNKKSDDKEEEKALKEAEIVAELAPDKETRKEAEELIETVENQSNTFAQDSSEIFDTYKKGILKITEQISKFQPQYAQSFSKLQEEYLQLTKEFVDKVFSAQRNWVGGNVTSARTTFPSWTYTPYAEQFRRQTDEITAQALSVYETSNHLALNALNAARENLMLYGRTMESIMEYINNVANAWSSFFTSAQRQQYFRQ
jgi:hypothetical protein